MKTPPPLTPVQKAFAVVYIAAFFVLVYDLFFAPRALFAHWLGG